MGCNCKAKKRVYKIHKYYGEPHKRKDWDRVKPGDVITLVPQILAMLILAPLTIIVFILRLLFKKKKSINLDKILRKHGKQ